MPKQPPQRMLSLGGAEVKDDRIRPLTVQRNGAGELVALIRRYDDKWTLLEVVPAPVAQVVGPFVVHLSLSYVTGWTLTHTETGCAIVSGAPDPRDAVDCARELLDLSDWKDIQVEIHPKRGIVLSREMIANSDWLTRAVEVVMKFKTAWREVRVRGEEDDTPVLRRPPAPAPAVVDVGGARRYADDD